MQPINSVFILPYIDTYVSSDLWVKLMKNASQSDALADALLHGSRERGDILTPLKLQKLMFYADAWNMALYDEELTSEKFQAWIHGPVAVSQYRRFKDYRWRPITADIQAPDLDPKVSNHIEEILDVFGVENAIALEQMTHQEEPWLRARGGLADTEACNTPIDKELTKRYYRSIAENAESKEEPA